MIRVLDKLYQNIDKSVIDNTPPFISYMVGNNGAGKSRILAKVCERYNSAEHDHVSSILCISNSVTDKFDYQAKYKCKYLGARSVNNAIFWSSLDREIAKQVCVGIRHGKRKYFGKLQASLGIDFFITFPKSIRKDSITKDSLASLVDKRKLKNTKITEKISLAGRNWLARAVRERIEISKVPIDRGIDLLKFLDLNPEVIAEVRKGSEFLRFHDLSSGEQNRISMALKILANAAPKLIVLIDEPELSLHMQWQAEFHEFLCDVTEGLSNYHIVIATHSPVIVSEATKGQGADTILILESGDDAREKSVSLDDLQCEVASANNIKSFEYAVLDYFKLATYNTPSFDMKIAELVLEAAEGRQNASNKILELEELQQVKNLPKPTNQVITEALELIRRHFIQGKQ
ncbi:putative ATPase [Pseudomonas brassicacearum]|uniref:ATPase n=1 Tax=Pseudomonas brassicacearum TaxID=930166 RepID=A0AAW8M685_9PSED|nr:AAA family ATPase [Pseudomonas brassicacearum]MDR6957253.1 putative ATPase [Pseudomonas brassicacearum]